MRLDLYQVDAFTNILFKGNPAAVCPLNNWLDDKILKNIAAENNLSETAFFVKKDNQYHIRWFTPTIEVDLCGHATLASAYVIFNFIEKEINQIVFESLSGNLTVFREDEFITLNFPARPPKKIFTSDLHLKCLDVEPKEVLLSSKTLFLLNSENEVLNAVPNFDEIKKLDSDGLIITAKGENCDFVSRYFAPHAGIPEDPVTGSAHTALTPYWSKKLNKRKLQAKQLSKRGGELFCEDLGDRINISGKAVLYSIGEIDLA
ncbi:MAG: PhzF family phenazine biosynthesis protein [Melioribacteraceae bacterium]|jgi:PhzF family phenazine biosynthesis protein|nr:MAG: PhzF family phenazine biosynthesis protein [Ignavibacteriales bacterium]WKZ69317.1 MAG: PhzF family phenazine biosynthesis protein [Melioribacteraceae bacterium]